MDTGRSQDVKMQCQPIIIIGAARSGTNMLRDMVSQASDCVTWPCDEINYIWRHGNRDHPTDALVPAQARPDVRAFIRSAFNRLSIRKRCINVIEKTCANSLRVPFVATVFPEAKFVFIIRDGRDAVSSALKRWRAPVDPAYLLRKARFVPVTDLPHYGIRYLSHRIRKIYDKNRALPTWGPRFEEMGAFQETHSLQEVVARQWCESVERASEAFQSMNVKQYCTVRYECILENPNYEMTRVFSFLGLDVGSEQLGRIASSVKRPKANSLVKACGGYSAAVESILSPCLRKFGYDTQMN